MIDRRFFIGAGAASAVALGFAPRLVFAKAATNKRFVFIIQRGAADGDIPGVVDQGAEAELAAGSAADG